MHSSGIANCSEVARIGNTSKKPVRSNLRGTMAALHNKTALVTGASRGIGRATASALAGAGAHVLVHYGRSVLGAESLVTDIRSKEGRADAIKADLGKPEGSALLAQEVCSIVGERLDVLVSNAGESKAA